MSKRTLWVVETRIGTEEEWEPTLYVGITEEQALEEQHDFQRQHPRREYRVRAYVPREGR